MWIGVERDLRTTSSKISVEIAGRISSNLFATGHSKDTLFFKVIFFFYPPFTFSPPPFLRENVEFFLSMFFLFFSPQRWPKFSLYFSFSNFKLFISPFHFIFFSFIFSFHSAMFFTSTLPIFPFSHFPFLFFFLLTGPFPGSSRR